MGNLNK